MVVSFNKELVYKMITKPTVLILGAGASAPYGFPVGTQLWEELCDKLKTGHLYDFLLSNGFSADDILNFRKNLFESGKTSIDAFLEHRTEFLDIGKLAIATVLTSYENSETLYDAGVDKWYKFLYEKMNVSSPEEFANNKISIITFNYDRSIEHFLFNSLKNTYGKSDEDCAREISKIKIIHLHGSLGYLPWQDKDGKHYQKDNSPEDIIRAAKNIRIIHENIDMNTDFIDARKILAEAERVYILGFGYHEINVQRLGIKNLSVGEGKEIIGSAENLCKKETDDKMKICGNNVSIPYRGDINPALDFLRQC